MRLSGTVFSKSLEMDTGIAIVTPNKLKDNEPYKVVYLLHGMCGSSSNWLDYSLLPVYANAGNSIYIMPDAARSFYTDMKYGLKYFTYITEELPYICKNIFNISADRENTAILGGSMGGYGALRCALSKPEQYGMCGAFSSCCLFFGENREAMKRSELRQKFIETFGEQLAVDLVSAFGEDIELKPEYEILELVKRAQSGGIMPKLYLTCGTEDYFYRDHLRFCQKLDTAGVEYEFEQWQAQHDFIYFNDALKKAIDKFSL